jgi:NTE family protein
LARYLKNIIAAAFVITMAFALVCCGTLKFSGAQDPYQPLKPNFRKPIKLALVLGGGGAKGFAHVGVIEELEKAGIKPDLIVGCSAGAIVGGFYALDPDAAHLKKTLMSHKRHHILSYSLSAWPYGFYADYRMREYFTKNLKKHNFSDTKIPFLVVATNLEFGNLTVFGTGDMIVPIMASAAFPGALPPVKIRDQYFVDGGVADPVPVQVAKQFGAEVVVAVNIAERLTNNSPNHFLGVMKRSIEIAYINQSARSAADADVIIDFHFTDIGAFSDTHNDYLYEAGKLAALKAIPAIKRKIELSNQ